MNRTVASWLPLDHISNECETLDHTLEKVKLLFPRTVPKNVVLVAVDSLHHRVLGDYELKMVTKKDRVSCEVNSIGATGAQPPQRARPTICIGARIGQPAQS